MKVLFDVVLMLELVCECVCCLMLLVGEMFLLFNLLFGCVFCMCCLVVIDVCV